MPRKCVIWSAIIGLLVASGCTVQIKNQRWYGDIGLDGAIYFETLSEAEGVVTKPEWDKLRFGMLCTDAQSFADTKAVIEKLCHESSRCTYEQVNQMRHFFLKAAKFRLDNRPRHKNP